MAEELLASADTPTSNLPPSTTTTTTISPSPSTSDPILIRPASLLQAPQIGNLASRVYSTSALTAFLSPHRLQHPIHYQLGYTIRATQRMLDARNHTVYASLRSNPSEIIGAAQFVRLGDDAGAWKQITSRGIVARLLLYIGAYIFSFLVKIFWFLVGGNKSDDAAHTALFASWGPGLQEKYWSQPERKCRWHAQSVIVDPKFHRRGIGRLMMREVVRRAEEEGVPVGLESSGPGSLLYGSLGFEMLGRFEGEKDFDGGRAGVMMWTPREWKEKESVRI